MICFSSDLPDTVDFFLDSACPAVRQDMFFAPVKRGKVLCVLISILALVRSTHVVAESLSPITFAAKKSDVLISSPQKPIRVKGEYLEVTLQGRLNNPGIDLPLQVKNFTDRSTPEKALRLDHHANVSDNGPLIVSGWMPADRPEIEKLLADPNIRSKNRALVSQIHRMSLKGIVAYKGYSLALVSYNNGAGPIHPVITMKKVGQEWLLSNALSDDDVLSILWSVHNGYGKMQITE